MNEQKDPSLGLHDELTEQWIAEGKPEVLSNGFNFQTAHDANWRAYQEWLEATGKADRPIDEAVKTDLELRVEALEDKQ